MICIFEMLKCFSTFFLICLLYNPIVVAAEKTYVYAASSLTGAITKAIQDFKVDTGLIVVPVFGASSTLARQIIQGAPANIFISANSLWMNKVEETQLIETGSRHPLASNRLILIALETNLPFINLFTPETLLTKIKNQRIAIANPNHVPAGMYAKKALQTLNLWSQIKNNLAMAANVRIALSYVERGEVPYGIVYESDIVGRMNIKRVANFPSTSHPTIIYPLAIMRLKSTETAQAFRRFLQSQKGWAILTQFGFTPLP
jgi:molybdate transport system substrate-binding protein